ncbi:MAG: glycosyltransferase family 2 protein [Candidatus Tenebribacter burtonii]|nr:glycosyltransferase family 2 protein [Candidatus Tenebribacter burtonii]
MSHRDTTVRKVSVIIPVYNGQKTLNQCLESVLDQSYENFEVIVVDNNSTDNTKKIIQSFKKKHNNLVYAFEVERKRGATRNTGEKLAEGEVIVMTDSDCIVNSDWLSEITKPIFDGECDAVQGFEVNIVDNFWARKIQQQNEKQIKYLGNQIDTIGLIDTKNFAISMKTLQEIGFTNRKYFSGNDTELSIRCQKKKLRLKFLPNVIVQHYNSDSFQEVIAKNFYRALWCTKITKDHKIYLKRTSFLKQTNQTIWSFCKFFPGLIKTLFLFGFRYTYFDFISGTSWRAGILLGKISNKLEGGE